MGAEVPQVRVRNLSWRQAQQLAELTVLNERLAAGNEGPSVIAARKRIEWLRARRRVWERIYKYVTKQDAAATLAVIEDANIKVGWALRACLIPEVSEECFISEQHPLLACGRWQLLLARKRASARAWAL